MLARNLRFFAFTILMTLFASTAQAKTKKTHSEETKKQATPSIEEAFNWVYRTGEWGKDEKGEGTSGSGSTFENAKPYMSFLTEFLKKHEITSVVDLGCGDWQFSQHINWQGIHYTGFDVVKSVVEKNKAKFSTASIQFAQADGMQTDLPKADLLICKDVLQHLPLKEIQNFLPQLKKYKYCLITNDVDNSTLTSGNLDIPVGAYRSLDLTKPPFNLKGTKVLTYLSGSEMKQVLLINNNF